MSEQKDKSSGSEPETRQQPQQPEGRGRSGEGAASILAHLAGEGRQPDVDGPAARQG